MAGTSSCRLLWCQRRVGVSSDNVAVIDASAMLPYRGRNLPVERRKRLASTIRDYSHTS